MMTWREHCDAVRKGKPGFPVVEVVWNDAVAVALGWEEEADTDLRLTTTVGYLVHESKKSLTVVSIINSEHIAHGITIPKPILRKRTL